MGYIDRPTPKARTTELPFGNGKEPVDREYGSTRTLFIPPFHSFMPRPPSFHAQKCPHIDPLPYLAVATNRCI